MNEDLGKPKAKGDESKALYRRPFGCAATSLSGANFDELLGKEYQPPNAAMTIYMPKEETQFFKIHESMHAAAHGSTAAHLLTVILFRFGVVLW